MQRLKNILKSKETAYRLTLGNESGKTVLRDLNSFCNGTRSNYSADALHMARMEGRREVYMRVMNFLKVDFDAYYNNIEDDIYE